MRFSSAAMDMRMAFGSVYAVPITAKSGAS